MTATTKTIHSPLDKLEQNSYMYLKFISHIKSFSTVNYPLSLGSMGSDEPMDFE